MSDSGDRMFCHACGGVWLRDDHGLICPHCESDFTEIIEIPPDTTADPTSLHDDNNAAPEQERSRRPPNPWADHNPWENEEPDEDGYTGGNGFRHRTYRSPDGRFTFSSTTYRHGFPDRPPGSGVPGDPLMPMVRSLDTIFRGLADTYRQQANPSPPPDDPFGGLYVRDEDYDRHYGPGRRLYPRDANSPQPMAPPFGTLGDLLELFRADFGVGAPGGGVRVMTGPNPMAVLSTLLNFDRNGDAVYSQEELDRVISQLIDQNMNATAPPPATEEAIHALPKKKVDKEMLGSEGKAECSICMEAVPLEAEVTMLPCKHWFHYTCIEMWLSQHNTCPHCRRGINSPESQGNSEQPTTGNDNHGSTSRGRRHRSPDQNGFLGHQPVPGTEPEENDRPSSSGSNYGGGIAGWVRSRFGGGN